MNPRDMIPGQIFDTHGWDGRFLRLYRGADGSGRMAWDWIDPETLERDCSFENGFLDTMGEATKEWTLVLPTAPSPHATDGAKEERSEALRNPLRTCEESLVRALEALPELSGWTEGWDRGAARIPVDGETQFGVYVSGRVFEDAAFADVQIQQSRYVTNFHAAADRSKDPDLFDRLCVALAKLPLKPFEDET